jgi:arsenate reductase-like glutaredoxin family protein
MTGRAIEEKNITRHYREYDMIDYLSNAPIREELIAIGDSGLEPSTQHTKRETYKQTNKQKSNNQHERDTNTSRSKVLSPTCTSA